MNYILYVVLYLMGFALSMKLVSRYNFKNLGWFKLDLSAGIIISLYSWGSVLIFLLFMELPFYIEKAKKNSKLYITLNSKFKG